MYKILIEMNTDRDTALEIEDLIGQKLDDLYAEEEREELLNALETLTMTFEELWQILKVQPDMFHAMVNMEYPKNAYFVWIRCHVSEQNIRKIWGKVKQMGRIEDIEDQENAVQLALGDVEESTDDYMWRDGGTSNEESVMMLKKLRNDLERMTECVNDLIKTIG